MCSSDLGIVPPIEFIPVAEQMHVVQDIDRIMFEKALVAIDRMQHGGLDIPKVSFNVSAARVSDPEIIASVQRDRKSTRLNSSH